MFFCRASVDADYHVFWNGGFWARGETDSGRGRDSEMERLRCKGGRIRNSSLRVKKKKYCGVPSVWVLVHLDCPEALGLCLKLCRFLLTNALFLASDILFECLNFKSEFYALQCPHISIMEQKKTTIVHGICNTFVNNTTMQCTAFIFLQICMFLMRFLKEILIWLKKKIYKIK